MTWVSQVSLVVKNLTASAGVTKDTGLIPESERSLGGGHGNPLQHSCLGNREAWQSTVHRVTESQPRVEVTENVHTHTHDIQVSILYMLYRPL